MKEKKVLLIGPNYPFSDNLLDVFIEQLRLSKLNFDLQTADGNDAILNESFDEILIVGSIPSNLSIRHYEVLSLATHFMFDKYHFQSVPYKLKCTKENIDKLLTSIYTNVFPKKIIVNNDKMKKDFESYAFDNNLNVKVSVSPNPISPLMIKRGKVMDATNYKLDNKSTILYDTTIPSNASTFTAFGSQILVCPASKDFLVPNNTNIIGLLNYRQKNGYFLSLRGKFDYFNELIRFSLRQYLTCISHFKIGYKVMLHSKKFGKCFVEDINTRWKPNTKFTVAVAMGLPLISQPEESISESMKKYGHPVYFFENSDDLQDTFSNLSSEIISLRDNAIISRKKIISKINEDFCKAILE